MMKKIVLLAFTALAASTPAFAYSSLDELMHDMNKQQVDAIRAYIEANPDAADIAEARERLVYGLVSIDDYAGAIALLEERYKALPEDKSELDLSSAFGELVVPLIQLYRMDGNKEKAVQFIEEVRGAFKDHAMIDTINESLDEFSKVFDQPGVGDTLDISFTAIDGREINLADLKGKVVLVDFWATWCVPCLKVMPEVKALYNDFHDRGFEIIGISLDSDKDKLANFVAKEEIAWPQYFDGEGWDNEIARRYGIESIPATFLIGPDGLIEASEAPVDTLRARIESLLASAESTTEPAAESAPAETAE